MSNELPWQVWTPDDLAPPPETFVPVEADNVTLTEDTPEPELTAEQQLEQELAQLKIQAHEQGYNAGLAEGRQKGHAQGYQEGLAQGLEQGQAQAQTQQAPIHARMQQLVSEFQNTLDALDSVIASRLMQMALEAARQVIGQTPAVDNSALIKQIQQLLQQEPLFSGKPQLRVHPDDLQRVEEMLGATCIIERQDGPETKEVESEVVGFNGQRLFLMPLEEVEGILPGARVYARNGHGDGLQSGKQLPLGPALLGRVLDGGGKPLDGLPAPDTLETGALITPPFNPLQRTPIEHVLDTGVRAINALLTVGRGQRMGLFAGSGVGKSVLLGMMARYTRADVIVVGLIGERGREVKDFIENILGLDGRARSVVIAAPADVSPLLRMQGAAYATRIAEDFRDRGQHVLLIMDSLTRYAMAQREIALAIGEPPATKGYPPSVFAKLPALVERAGNGIHGGGSITAFYTVLTEGDDQQDPIADSARAILDGHIVLSRRLAEAGHYPAIDIEASISRAMTALITEQHYARVRLFKQLLSSFQRNRDLVSVGAYAKGSDPMLDKAITLWPQLEAFLQQGIFERADWEDSLQALDLIFPTV
ncbi:flagellum-specific ATP synthase FliI [Salmonella enterica]|nr:flagellum-specific ATP synthase FliI [Salmonella enterica]